MISNITNTFIKAKKAFDISQFTESKNLLNKVIDHDKDFLSAYLLLYEIYDKTNSKKKNIIYKELISCSGSTFSTIFQSVDS